MNVDRGFRRSPPRPSPAGLLLAPLALAVALVGSCTAEPPVATLEVQPQGALQRHYLVDYEYSTNEASLDATTGHLVVFNPGRDDAHLDVTVFFEDADPVDFRQVAKAAASTESDAGRWPVPPGRRFALAIESDRPVIAQATLGRTNTGGRYETGAVTADGAPYAEAATSYVSLGTPARHWKVADGIVIEAAGRLWLRETETAILLNPGDENAEVRFEFLLDGERRTHRVEVPARRLRRVSLAGLVPANRHYGTTIESDQPILAQWRREVYREGSPRPLSFWSLPATPFETRPESD